ncbi:MAG: Flp pilus assembly complex ATPase component TadA [Alphaproteobacteria bacterium]|nr:Flp pilus assembly complex ATPase component TadA [Alphaproteobacteria bacterium]
MSSRQYQSGDIIYSAGDASDVAYVVQQGQVEIADAQGTKKIFGTGHLFGELGVIKDVPRQETVRAVEAVVLHCYSEQELEAMVYQTPAEVQQMIMHLVEDAENNTDSATTQEPQIAVQPTQASNDPFAAFYAGMDRFTKMLEERASTAAPSASAPRPAVAAERAVEEELTPELLRELSDLGAINVLLEDDDVNDILINGHGQIYVERQGKLEPTDLTYPDEAAVMDVANKIVRTLGRKVDRRRPLIDARLLDGSRVNIIAPPLAVDGTSISIRKFAKKKITLDVMRENQNVSPQLADFLRICGKVRLNIVISGGTGSGKTTMLNAISQSIDHNERVVTIEDAAELQLQQPHVVRLETKPISSGAALREEVTMRDLVKNSLRMRPDRILVGEVRGAEAFDMMQAMNTGHEGSLTTIHANHPRDALSRLENMVSMANLNIPHSSIRYQIASAINIIVQISRMRDGHRRITHVCEIVGMEGDIITMQDLFVFAIDGEDKDGKLRGQFRWTGIMPRFLRRVAYYGEAENLSRALGVKLPKF